jgi:Excalibur calcium-binding domain
LKKLVLIVAIGLAAWYGFTRYENHSSAKSDGELGTSATLPIDALSGREDSSSPTFACDGRKRCPQMHSCEEATYFLKHCPGVEMDGDGDGIPCESQWCSGG